MADPLSVTGGVLGVMDLADLVDTLSTALHVVRNQNPNSVIVLSFRALQAQRIEALQRDILGRIENHLRDIPEADTNHPNRQTIGEWKDMTDQHIDHMLHNYGSVYTSSVVSVYI
jgi:hypothetical protein